MATASTRTLPINPRQLSHNTLRFLFLSDTVEATRWLYLYQIPFRIMKSGEGYWVNVTWPNGITGPLSYQELAQLPNFQTLRGDQNVQDSNQIHDRR